MEDQTLPPAETSAASAQSVSLQTHAWDADAYARNGRFVAEMAQEVTALLAPQPGETILDLGCGDGALTQRLAASGADVIGLDASSAMVTAALARGVRAIHGSAVDLPFTSHFHAIFSNAALHWIPASDQACALASIYQALQPGGRFVAEMGGQGNIAAVRTALSATLKPFGLNAENAAASFFPSPAHYQSLLEQAGFSVEQISLHPRPTPLPHGKDGMRTWLNTFRSGVLDQLPPAAREPAVREILSLLDGILSDADGTWTADYVRLRFCARRLA